MKLKNVLILGMSGLLLLLLAISLTGLFQMRELNNDMVLIVKNRYHKVDLVKTIPIELLNTSRALRGLVLDDSKIDQRNYLTIIDNSNSEVSTIISTLEGISENVEIDKVAELRGAFENYMDYEKQIISLVQSDKYEEAKKLILDNSTSKSDKIIQEVNDLGALEKAQMENALNQSQGVFYRGLVIFLFLVASGLISGIILSLWIIKSIIGSINQLANAMKRISSFADKTSLPRLENKKNELGQLSEAFNEMAMSLEQHARQEIESTQAFREQHWLQSKVAETHALFQGIQNAERFSRLLIRWVCQTVGASYGNFYIRSGGKGSVKLINMASYAGNGQEVGLSEFRPGEGLIGQCYLENQIINLTEALDQYIEITTGLGKITPKHLKLLPVEFETKVVAIIELASLSEFSLQEREFLEQVRWNIGIILNRIEEHAEIQKLLVESQTLTEELQTQSEELQTQQEELKTFHEKLEEQYIETERKNKQLLDAKVSLEEQAHRLESSSQYKSEFLSNMSHELRTPLNSLLILARMLWENNNGNLSSKQVEYAKTIWTSGNDLLNLINDILDLSKIESGKVTVKVEKFSLSELKEELEKQFYPIACEKEIIFVINIYKDIPDNWVTDRHYLKQILTNLLSNALKFTDQGQVILTIQRAFKVLSQCRFSDDNKTSLAFCVSDTGIGIPADKQKLIFEAFQQADGTTSRRYGGTGLGLFICRELAALLGGSIEITSKEGSGSTFSLILPNNAENTLTVSESLEGFNNVAEGLVIPNKDPDKINDRIVNVGKVTENTRYFHDLTGLTVLVVDDDMRNIFAISAALEALKINVLFAEDGKEALEKLKSNNTIDLILMDIMMPEMDGYETMKSIRQIPEYRTMPIIALTAKAMKGDREEMS
ncbi:ATP-binding protein [Desulfosporosinus sp. SB140]|uniref:ATP-binding protein n=1 Tax=Desulfosporosinus paludis TaxID=3115649 RepID=UPI0038904EB7